MKAIESLFCKMREVKCALDESKHFRFNAELNSDGRFAAYLWSYDFKNTILSFVIYDIESGENAQEALGDLAYILGYAKGYLVGDAEAKEIDFATGEKLKQAIVEA